MKRILASLFITSAILFAAPSSTQAETVTVFAAASLTESLKEIAVVYEKESGDKVTFNFGASGTLSRQIEAGAPVDIFLSADEVKMDALEKKGLIVKDTRRNQLENSLVIIAALEDTQIHSATDLTNAAIKRIALGDTKIVPAGTYAKTYFEKLGVWSTLEPKAIPCENVRAVLAAVESGNVEAGVVYKTDAAISKKVKVAYEVPASEGPKILYPIALLSNAPSLAAARKFQDYLASSKAGEIFVHHGFVVVPPVNK